MTAGLDQALPFLRERVKEIFIPAESSGTLNRIQDVVDSFDKNGGKITLGPGRHLSTPLVLRSNLHLDLEDGSELVFPDDFSQYGIVKTRWEGVECYALRALIFAENASGIRISGGGTIDGQGSRWWAAYRAVRNGTAADNVKEIQQKLLSLNSEASAGSGGGGRETGFLRPPLIQMKSCSSVVIDGVKLQNSPFWNTHILYCEKVVLTGLSFINPPDAPNTDGLDIDSSRGVLVDGCHFNVGDDCLCIKSGMDEDGIRLGRPSEDITVKNCHMESGHGGIVIGSETSGGIANVSVSGCTMTDTDRGIRIKTRRGRGGSVRDISIDNIRMNRVAAPIVVNMFYRCGASDDELRRLSSPEIPADIDEKKTPVIQDIRIENVRAENISSSAAFFLGLPESPVRNLTLKSFSASSKARCSFEEPAMDLFYTEACGARILYRFIENPNFENIRIDDEAEEIIMKLQLEGKYD